ncbi:unknown [Firmicutes bacterium CAG:791]|nr:unknown [Firmicutes bacterium CAG:791]
MHAKRHGSILDFVTKGQLHLVAVAFRYRTLQNPLKPGVRIRICTPKKLSDLLLLQGKLFPLRKVQVEASAAGTKARTFGQDLRR